MEATKRLALENGPGDGRVALVGELDVATCGELDGRLQAADPASTVSLDLSGITFMDSSGLRVVIEHHNRFEEAGGQLQLADLSSPVARLLQIAGLENHLHVD
jgi:anti-sigma B factor antagonist